MCCEGEAVGVSDTQSSGRAEHAMYSSELPKELRRGELGARRNQGHTHSLQNVPSPLLTILLAPGTHCCEQKIPGHHSCEGKQCDFPSLPQLDGLSPGLGPEPFTTL